jgi:hypothetical protein
MDAAHTKEIDVGIDLAKSANERGRLQIPGGLGGQNGDL